MTPQGDVPQAAGDGGEVASRGATAVLTVGALVSGLAAYAFVTVGNRGIGAAAFAPVSVVWSLWAATVAFLTFPLQHLTVRSLVADPTGRDLRRLVPSFVRLSTAVTLGVTFATWLAGPTLFGSRSLLYPLAVGLSTLGSGAMGMIRGTFAGRGRYGAAAYAMAGENVVRLLAASAVVAAGLGAQALALTLVVGPLAVVGSARWLWGQWRSPLDDTGAPQPVSGVIRLTDVVSVGGGTLVSQVILSGPPVLLAALDANPVAVTSTFAAITAFRAPYLLGLGAGLRAMAWLSELHAQLGPRALRRWTVRTLVAGSVLGFLAGAVAVPAGLPVLRFLFGASIDLAPLHLAFIAAGCTWALASLGVVLIAMALHRSSVIARGWIAATVVGGVVVALNTSTPTFGVSLGFAVAELTALLFVAGPLLRGPR